LQKIQAGAQDALLPVHDIPNDVQDGKNDVFAILDDVFAGKEAVRDLPPAVRDGAFRSWEVRWPAQGVGAALALGMPPDTPQRPMVLACSFGVVVF